MPTRFVDASVFVHAFLSPRRALKPHEERIKEHARGIVRRVNEGEPVVTSSVHIAEVANLLEAWMPLSDAHTIQRGLLTRESVAILAVVRQDLVEALTLAVQRGVGVTDALAATLMARGGLREIYSFDRDFDRIGGVRRISA